MRTPLALQIAAFSCLAAMALASAATKSDKVVAISSSEPRADMVGALLAAGPHASLGEQAREVQPLVGSWDVEYMDILKDGSRKHRTGQLIVAWVLDGRAIQDVWIVDPSEARQEREVYADIRYFDAKTRTWPTVFIDPEHASMARFTGGATADGHMVLQTSDLGHPENRWSFVDIEPERCVFRDEYSLDGGVSWKLQAEYHLKRHHTASSR